MMEGLVFFVLGVLVGMLLMFIYLIVFGRDADEAD